MTPTETTLPQNMVAQTTWRWLTILGVSQVSLLLVNAVLALNYKHFTWQPEAASHIGAFLLAWAILSANKSVNHRLETDFPWADSIPRRLFVQIALNVAITVLFVFVVRNLVLHLLSAANAATTISFVRVQDELMIILVVVFFTLAAVLADLGIFLMRQWQESSTEAERVKKENLEFRFDRLRNQVNPHFLFNSLNTLASLVYQDPDTASRFVRQMAKVYRYVLENRDKEVISLADEWTFIEAYLYLVKIRFEDGVRFELDLPKEILHKMIPPMTLQLLIENALKHNIVSNSRPLTISITAQGNTLEIANNIQPKLSPEPSTKTGLENIKSRYAFLTSQPVVIFADPGTFKVGIPLLEPEENHPKKD